jgi:RecG-like helicase
MASARLKVIYESNDGFAIAQADLNLRGPGEFLGLRQSGVPMLKIADLNRDADLLEYAKMYYHIKTRSFTTWEHYVIITLLSDTPLRNNSLYLITTRFLQ